MEGEGFEIFKEAGDRVKNGDKLLSLTWIWSLKRISDTDNVPVSSAHGKELYSNTFVKADNEYKIHDFKIILGRK